VVFESFHFHTSASAVTSRVLLKQTQSGACSNAYTMVLVISV